MNKIGQRKDKINKRLMIKKGQVGIDGTKYKKKRPDRTRRDKIGRE